MQRLIFFFLQALRNCKVFYSKLSFYWKFWLETNFTFFFLLEKSEKFSRKSWKEVNFLGDVLIDWGIIVLKTICQICDVKVWTERDTGTGVVSFSLQWRTLVLHNSGVVFTSWATVGLPVPVGLCSVKLVILVNSAPKSWLVLANHTIKFLVCVCRFVRSCAFRNSKIHVVKWETAELITSAVLHHSRCRLLFEQKRAATLWCMSGVSRTGAMWGAERPLYVQTFPYTFLI